MTAPSPNTPHTKEVRFAVVIKRLTWIARLGKLFWGLVEVAVPQSIPNLMLCHWLKLLYLFEVIIIVGGILLARPGASQFGWTALGITAGVNFLAFALGDYLVKSGKVKGFTTVVGAAVIAFLALIGLLKVVGVWGLELRGAPPLALIRQSIMGMFPLSLSKDYGADI